jgi:hypothetical protein
MPKHPKRPRDTNQLAKLIHKTLRVTPAMAAGVADRLWEVADIVRLWEAVEPKAGKRGPYKKQISDLPTTGKSRHLH